MIRFFTGDRLVFLSPHLIQSKAARKGRVFRKTVLANQEAFHSKDMARGLKCGNSQGADLESSENRVQGRARNIHQQPPSSLLDSPFSEAVTRRPKYNCSHGVKMRARPMKQKTKGGQTQ
jgi:hypothetical protein